MLATALAFACQPEGVRSAPRPADAYRTPPSRHSQPEAQPTTSELSVDSDDGIWGSALAPVTVLVFTDLQCQFCARAHASLVELERHYGEARLRVVIKHVPLADHAGSVPAARAAQAILSLYGRTLFFRYIDHVFQHQVRVARGEALPLAGELGLDIRKVGERASSAAIGAQVLADVLLADRIAVSATPHFRINGVGLTGALPSAELGKVIDAELAEAEALLGKGVPAAEVYPTRVRSNLALEKSGSFGRVRGLGR